VLSTTRHYWWKLVCIPTSPDSPLTRYIYTYMYTRISLPIYRERGLSNWTDQWPAYCPERERERERGDIYV
jgi:hypothetical protein